MSCATCAPVSSTQKRQGMRQNLLGMGTESMAHGPHGPSGGVPHCLWDSAQDCRGRAGQRKDILVWEHPCPHLAGHGSGTDPTDTHTPPAPAPPWCFPRVPAKAAPNFPTSHFKQTLMGFVMDVLNPSTKPAMDWPGIQRRKRPGPGQEVQGTHEGAE